MAATAATKVVKWKEIITACHNHGDFRYALVDVFTEYEGEDTDEKDKQNRPVKVTANSFARHLGIPVRTFRDWVDNQRKPLVEAPPPAITAGEKITFTSAKRKERETVRKAAVDADTALPKVAPTTTTGRSTAAPVTRTAPTNHTGEATLKLVPGVVDAEVISEVNHGAASSRSEEDVSQWVKEIMESLYLLTSPGVNLADKDRLMLKRALEDALKRLTQSS